MSDQICVFELCGRGRREWQAGRLPEGTGGGRKKAFSDPHQGFLGQKPPQRDLRLPCAHILFVVHNVEKMKYLSLLGFLNLCILPFWADGSLSRCHQRKWGDGKTGRREWGAERKES